MTEGRLATSIVSVLGAKPSHGTVVRWETKAGYLYMALAVERPNGSLLWYTTGDTSFMPRRMTSRELLAALDADCTSLGVTNEFEEVPL